jgi:hypothetical protein
MGEGVAEIVPPGPLVQVPLPYGNENNSLVPFTVFYTPGPSPPPLW